MRTAVLLTIALAAIGCNQSKSVQCTVFSTPFGEKEFRAEAARYEHVNLSFSRTNNGTPEDADIVLPVSYFRVVASEATGEKMPLSGAPVYRTTFAVGPSKGTWQRFFCGERLCPGKKNHVSLHFTANRTRDVSINISGIVDEDNEDVSGRCTLMGGSN